MDAMRLKTAITKCINMKQLLFLFIALISLEAYSQTNSYHPFPDSNAHWHGVILSGQVPPFPGVIGNFDYVLNGNDTIINTWTYKKITGYTGLWNMQLIGIRQDITNKKVFGIDGNTLQEVLLYDFDLNVGDTIRFRPLVQCDSISIVTSIDSVWVGSSYRKRYNLNLNVSLIEGIGSTSGLVESNCFEGANLLCYYTNNSDTVFSDDTSPWLCKPNAIEELDQLIDITVYPNPFTNDIQINFNQAIGSIKKITLYTILGAKQLEYTTTKKQLVN
jgi:hypothetical protein